MPIDPPSTPLLRIAENDTTLPVAGGPNKIAPTGNLLTVGYDKNNSFGAQHFNYFADNAGEYLQYLVDCVNDLNSTVESLQDQINDNETAINRLVPSVGEIWITEGSEDPATKFGVGTWTRIEESFLVGFQSGDPDFGIIGGTGGVREHSHVGTTTTTTTTTVADHILTVQELPSTAPFTLQSSTLQSGGTDPANSNPLGGDADPNAVGASNNINWNGGGQGHDHTATSTSTSSTSLSVNGNLPPYRVVNIWRRTA